LNPRGIWVHIGLLLAASASAIYVWTRDPKAAAAPRADVSVWSGRPEDVQRVAFESPSRKISLDSRKDAQGQWFLGTAQSTAAPAPDGGPPGGPPAAGKSVVFVSAGAALKIAQALAPFKALREIGRVEAARAGEFGFKEPPSTLLVNIAGQAHRLTVGGATPSGGDRYVRDESSGTVYAVHGDCVRDFESGESALLERDLHVFQDADLESARIVAGGKTRDVLRRGPASKRIWADPSSPDKADETLANWLNKVDRLRPSEYVEEAKARNEPVVRIEYAIRGAQGVFVEIAKAPGEGGKAEYFLRSEHTRLWTKVYAPWAEQVEQDLPSVLK
jgi:hypothetical protein